jgi:hypothetical protein
MPAKDSDAKNNPSDDDAPEVVTVERINKLVDIVVPALGCTGNDSNVVALALAELVSTLTSKKTKYADGEDGEWFAYFVARRAYMRTGHFEDALEDWQDKRVEGLLRKGGGR